MEQQENMRPNSKIVNRFESLKPNLLNIFWLSVIFLPIGEIYPKSKTNLWKVTGPYRINWAINLSSGGQRRSDPKTLSEIECEEWWLVVVNLGRQEIIYPLPICIHLYSNMYDTKSCWFFNQCLRLVSAKYSVTLWWCRMTSLFIRPYPWKQGTSLVGIESWCTFLWHMMTTRDSTTRKTLYWTMCCLPA